MGCSRKSLSACGTLGKQETFLVLCPISKLAFFKLPIGCVVNAT